MKDGLKRNWRMGHSGAANDNDYAALMVSKLLAQPVILTSNLAHPIF